jgi:hypothetical protein
LTGHKAKAEAVAGFRYKENIIAMANPSLMQPAEMLSLIHPEFCFYLQV